MRMILFSSRQYDSETFREANTAHGYDLHFQESHLDAETAVLADGFEVVCPFVNDCADAAVLERLHAGGTRLIALRSAGFNHVDLAAAERLGITVVRVPAYSPYAVAEHAVGLISPSTGACRAPQREPAKATFRCMGCSVSTCMARRSAWSAPA